MALNKAKDSSLPSTAVNTSFLVTPEDYIIEIYEIGVSKTNPIKGVNNGVKKWDKRNCETLFDTGNLKTIHVYL